jgi:hypothetical protein
MKATATRTYYFETWNEETVLRDVLQRYSCDKLRYYKYVQCNGKIIGVLQFAIRFSKTVLWRLFDEDGVYMSALKPVNTPLVLVHLRVYLLATYNGVDINDCWEWGRFGFGGRHTSINQMMQPYMVAL